MNKKVSVLWLIIILFLTHCQTRKLLQKDTHLPGKVKIKRKFESQKIEFHYLNCKSKIEYTDGLDNFTSNANIRICKDSVIWVSINPALGIEVVRCLINRDSVMVLNKLHKEYYIFSFKELSKKLNFEINYDLIQSILFGNLPFKEETNDSSSSTSDSAYVILQQTRKNVLAESFVKPKTLKLERISLKDQSTGNSLDISYENFLPLERVLFPFINKLSLNYRSKKGFENIYIGIEHHKLEPSNKNLNFPFTVPSRYVRKGQ